MNAQVRANVAIVPQSPTLFSGTVRENLIGGNPIREGVDMSDAALLATLRTCCLGALADKGLDGTLEVCSDNLPFLRCFLLFSTFDIRRMHLVACVRSCLKATCLRNSFGPVAKPLNLCMYACVSASVDLCAGSKRRAKAAVLRRPGAHPQTENPGTG